MSVHASGPDLLQQNVGAVRSRMGAFYPGSHVIFRGQDLHKNLKDMDWLELYVFGITGRRFTSQQLRLMHAIWTYTSYPDLRIWNNRVAALAGSARSTGNLGVAAALAISEASIYGRGIDKRAIAFFIAVRESLEKGETLEACVLPELEMRRSIAGYGRPVVNGDERNQHIMALARSLGLADGPYIKLAFRIEEFLLTGRWRMKMNYGGVVAALGADLGLSPQEYYLFMFPAFLAGMQPCVIEAFERPEGTVYPVRCRDIVYSGKSRRTWSQPAGYKQPENCMTTRGK